ncbi:MAG TPA: hypothetical protein VJ844_10255 [Mucilaginibacter sp.]|nr:hypothetical protein [Mucilaginibacter sp.]
MSEQRIKEIGVRKVHGASVFSLWQLLSKDFAILVFLSNNHSLARSLSSDAKPAS